MAGSNVYCRAALHVAHIYIRRVVPTFQVMLHVSSTASIKPCVAHHEFTA